MKKLMIAAIAAATVSGAFADSLCEESVAASGCSVYNVKFTLKTLAAKKKNCTKKLAELNGNGVWTRYVNDADATKITNASTLLDGGELITDDLYKANWTNANAPEKTEKDLYWADNATRTLEGILWQCKAACFDGDSNFTGSGSGAIFFALWEKKTEKCFSYPVFRLQTKAGSFLWVTEDEDPQFQFMGRYGQKATKIAVAWNPRTKGWSWDWIDAVGFGTFDSKNIRMKSVSGGCVASLMPYVAGQEDDCGIPNFFKIQIAYVCQQFKQWCCDPCFAAVDWVPAYGTWSLKYNSSLSKGTKPLSKILPEYAIFEGNVAATDVTKTQINAVYNSATPYAKDVTVVFNNGIATVYEKGTQTLVDNQDVAEIATWLVGQQAVDIAEWTAFYAL